MAVVMMAVVMRTNVKVKQAKKEVTFVMIASLMTTVATRDEKMITPITKSLHILVLLGKR